MRGRSGLSLGFSRRTCVLLAPIIFALSLCPGIAHAQDVMVLPPSTDAPSSTPAIFSTNTAAAPEALPPDNAVRRDAPEPIQLEPAPPESKPDLNYLQCTKSADCVFVEGDCGLLHTANRKYADQVRAALPRCVDRAGPYSKNAEHAALTRKHHGPECRDQRCVFGDAPK